MQRFHSKVIRVSDKRAILQICHFLTNIVLDYKSVVFLNNLKSCRKAKKNDLVESKVNLQRKSSILKKSVDTNNEWEKLSWRRTSFGTVNDDKLISIR